MRSRRPRHSGSLTPWVAPRSGWEVVSRVAPRRAGQRGAHLLQANRGAPPRAHPGDGPVADRGEPPGLAHGRARPRAPRCAGGCTSLRTAGSSVRGSADSYCELAGTVPVHRREDDPALVHRNEEMFRACHRAARRRRGGADLSGGHQPERPQGGEAQDRRGAAGAGERVSRRATRADSHCCRSGCTSWSAIAFKSDVVLPVGRPIELEQFRATFATDEAAAVRDLTERIQVAIERLILHVPSDDLAKLVRDVERLYREELRALAPDAPDLARRAGRGGLHRVLPAHRSAAPLPACGARWPSTSASSRRSTFGTRRSGTGPRRRTVRGATGGARGARAAVCARRVGAQHPAVPGGGHRGRLVRSRPHAARVQPHRLRR